MIWILVVNECVAPSIRHINPLYSSPEHRQKSMRAASSTGRWAVCGFITSDKQHEITNKNPRSCCCYLVVFGRIARCRKHSYLTKS